MKNYILYFLLSTSFLLGQINDGNFKKEVSKGFVVVKFTAEWSAKNSAYDDGVLDKVKGLKNTKVIEVKSEEASGIVRKLRLRSFPSIVLYHNGSKKKVWKADMRGNLDVTDESIEKEINNILAGDVF